MSDYNQYISNISPVLARPWELIIARAKGVYVWDQQGRRYLDFTSGISVTNIGHCHPKVVQAVKNQAEKTLHAQANMFYHEPMLRLIKQLIKVVPAPIDTFVFANSGSEAVEGAIKLAKHSTGRTNIIAFERSFHGRTVGAMSVTSVRTSYRAGYQPLMSGVFFAPYAYCFRCPAPCTVPRRYDPENCCDWPLEQLRFILSSQTSPKETAGILVEPVLGQGGFIVPPKRFLRGLREICDEHGILLIIDEVHSGFGRTGKFFAIDHFGIKPDILIMGKAIASGLPLSCIAAPKKLMEKWEVGSQGGTFCGNIVACAAADATIQVIMEDGFLEHTQQVGDYLQKQLSNIKNKYKFIGDVRGLGLMIGIELVKPGTIEPDGELAKKIQRECFTNKLLLSTCSTYQNVIRWMPPLNINYDDIDNAIHIFESVLIEITNNQSE
jgi:4-aminobutyrate aminotransferase